MVLNPIAPGVDAVRLMPDEQWGEIARWCGGTVQSRQSPHAWANGEWFDYVDIPQVSGESLKAYEGQWVVRYPDGTFKVFYDGHMPERALWPTLWAKLAAHDGEGCACRGDENVGCRDRHDGEFTARWALRVVVEHLGLRPEMNGEHVPFQIGTHDREGFRTHEVPGDVCLSCSDPGSGRWVPVSQCPSALAALDAEEEPQRC